MIQLLFSYGTLQKESVQLALFGRVLQGTSDVLNGYVLSSIEIKDEGFLSRGEQKLQQTIVQTGNPGDQVKGTVFELADAELRKADAYEPENYRRVKIRLASGKEAWIYAAVENL